MRKNGTTKREQRTMEDVIATISDEKIYEITIGIYKQAALDIEDLLVGKYIKDESIYQILEYIADGPLDVKPTYFLKKCIEKRMLLSHMDRMPREWQQYLDYAWYLQDEETKRENRTY